MSDATLVYRLFRPPGCPAADGDDLQRLAATAHAALLTRACADGGSALGQALAPLRAFLAGVAPAAAKRRLLCHPLLIEGLHALAPLSDALRHWHDSVAAATPAAASAPAALGNVALALVLRADPNWCGEIDLCTDVLGRVGFPFCDWTLSLHTAGDELLANRVVRLTLGPAEACWRLADTDGPPFLVTSRADCLRMLVGNADPADRDQLQTPDAAVRPRLQQAGHFSRSAIRYDPVGFRDGHAGLTGGLVGRVLAAIRRNSPAVHRELARLIHTVRGFEFPPAAGVGASFSDPTLPGVMGVGLSYSTRDEPCLDPFCFTWFGHELGHTKDYLCDSVLYSQGQALVLNPAELTGPIPRYGRPLAVRTLFQVPYVHLYEWALLMDFWEAGFRGLPWPAPAGAAAVGDDLAAEIKEAFALIRERAKLTPLGEVALRHFRELYGLALARWRYVRSHGGQ
jgi:hypothetical protein